MRSGGERSAPASLALAVALGLTVAAPGRAAADDPAFVLSILGCDGLERAELLRLLELEMAEFAPGFRERGAPPVDLVCFSGRMTIRILDPVTAKGVIRTVPHAEAEGAERAVALAVSQLFAASWLELLLPERGRPALPERPEAERDAAERAAREALPQRALAPEPSGPPTTVRVWALGGVGLRDLSAPLGTGRAQLLASVAPTDDWALVAGATLEHGNAHRRRGDVSVWLGGAELGLAAPILRAQGFRLWLGGRLGVLWGRLRGETAEPDVRPGVVDDVGARAVASLRPELRLGPAILCLDLQIGVDLHLPEGQVSGEPDVAPGGAFGSLGLGVGFVFGG